MCNRSSGNGKEGQIKQVQGVNKLSQEELVVVIQVSQWKHIQFESSIQTERGNNFSLTLFTLVYSKYLCVCCLPGMKFAIAIVQIVS